MALTGLALFGGLEPPRIPSRFMAAVGVVLIFRGWRTLRDLGLGFGAFMVASLSLSILDGDWLRGVGMGFSAGIAAALTMLATSRRQAPRPVGTQLALRWAELAVFLMFGGLWTFLPARVLPVLVLPTVLIVWSSLWRRRALLLGGAR